MLASERSVPSFLVARSATVGVLALVAGCGSSSDSPMSGATRAAQSLGSGLTSALEGKDPATAFDACKGAVGDGLVDEVRKAGGKKAALGCLNYPMVLWKGDAPVFRVAVQICHTQEKTGLMGISARPVTDPKDSIRSYGKPADSFSGGSSVFREVADQLSKALKGSSCSSLPLLTEAELDSVTPPSKQARARKSLEATPKTLAEVCSAIAPVAWDSVRLHLDEGYFVAQDESGKPVGAIGLDIDDVDEGPRCGIRGFQRWE
jgi:hypothetical protein